MIDQALVKRRTWWIKWMWVVTFSYLIFILVALFAIRYEVETVYLIRNKVRQVVSTTNHLLQYWADTTNIEGLHGWRLYALLTGLGLISMAIDVILTRFVYIQLNPYFKALKREDISKFKSYQHEYRRMKLLKKKEKYDG